MSMLILTEIGKMNEKLVHRTKTSLREEAKAFLPTVKEFYPHLDDMLTDRIAKYCAIYSKGTDTENIWFYSDSLKVQGEDCLLYTSPSPRDISGSRMPSSA